MIITRLHLLQRRLNTTAAALAKRPKLTQLTRQNAENVELVENNRGEVVTFTQYTNRELDELRIESLGVDENPTFERLIKTAVLLLLAVVYVAFVEPEGIGLFLTIWFKNNQVKID